MDLSRLCKRSRRGAGGGQPAASLHTVHEATVERLPATADLFRLRSPAAAVAAQEEPSRGGAQISSSSSSSSGGGGGSMLRLTLVADSLPRQLVQRLVACLRALAQPEAEGGVAPEALAASVMERLLRGGDGEGGGSQGAASAAASASAVAAAAAAAAVLRAGTVSWVFPSWNRSILTEIYICHACSYQKIEDGNAWAGGTSAWAVVGARGCAATKAPPQCVCGQRWGGGRQPISNGRCCQRRQWQGEDGGMRSR
eukprot:COSAG01_NODE_1289_length_10885_cov_3.769331_16_plen_255_part_00